MKYHSSKSQYSLLGSSCALVALVFITISFCTPYWLVSDGLNLSGKKFRRLGLWEACFDNFYDDHYRYDYEFSGCRWIFHREFRIIRHLLEPPFFVATQTLFTIGFTLLLIASLTLMAVHLCAPAELELRLTQLTALLLITSAVFNSVAVIVFGALGDGRDWMPDPDHNYLSWSFVLGVIGTLVEYFAGVLLLVDGKHLRKEIESDNKSFQMQPQPPRGPPQGHHGPQITTIA
ncbi:hypothetical protein BIW11_02195 [Tropilaelaps mercedesae]|uniref:Uncharacterized protein n=1 Tax=Tropilaelaps mercedesae TaxID=418985 RepID=A0A1V9X228_9ACAR|nr:hypothetical protein BIW11_02195 [Tropilaelaps mercedesae]